MGIDKKPSDIDITMAGEPQHIDKIIDKKGMSHFMTEKFGTITLIKDPIKYELTPLRTETDYTDFRHPGEITRSNDLLLDSARRDFTINCMYYTNITHKKEYTPLLDNKNTHTYTDDETFLKRLDDHGYLYIANSNLLIIQNQNHITKLFADGKLQSPHLLTMLKSAITFTIGKKVELHKVLRIVIDPHKGIHDSMNRRLKAV